jgi:hypothetical protein
VTVTVERRCASCGVGRVFASRTATRAFALGRSARTPHSSCRTWRDSGRSCLGVRFAGQAERRHAPVAAGPPPASVRAGRDTACSTAGPGGTSCRCHRPAPWHSTLRALLYAHVEPGWAGAAASRAAAHSRAAVMDPRNAVEGQLRPSGTTRVTRRHRNRRGRRGGDPAVGNRRNAGGDLTARWARRIFHTQGANSPVKCTARSSLAVYTAAPAAVAVDMAGTGFRPISRSFKPVRTSYSHHWDRQSLSASQRCHGRGEAPATAA